MLCCHRLLNTKQSFSLGGLKIQYIVLRCCGSLKLRVSWLSTLLNSYFRCTQTCVSPPFFPVSFIYHSQQNPNKWLSGILPFPWRMHLACANESPVIWSKELQPKRLQVSAGKSPSWTLQDRYLFYCSFSTQCCNGLTFYKSTVLVSPLIYLPPLLWIFFPSYADLNMWRELQISCDNFC